MQRELNDKKDMIINIFSEYVEPMLKVINHAVLLQERKQNTDATEYERNIGANLYKPSEEKNRHDSDLYWPTSIKYTINYFPFLTVMGHTANITKTNKVIIPSLLKEFAMFAFCLIDDKEKLDVIAIRCVHFFKRNKFIFTKFNI